MAQAMLYHMHSTHSGILGNFIMRHEMSLAISFSHHFRLQSHIQFQVLQLLNICASFKAYAVCEIKFDKLCFYVFIIFHGFSGKALSNNIYLLDICPKNWKPLV